MSSGARSRNARRRGSWRCFRADATDRLVALALAQPEPERSACVLYVLEARIAADAVWHLRRETKQDARRAHIRAYALVCETLRPFVDAGVLGRDEAAKAAHDAVMAADVALVAGRMQGAA